MTDLKPCGSMYKLENSNDLTRSAAASKMGSARTARKAEASKVNGAKGGKPRRLYQGPAMDVAGPRSRIKISKTQSGIIVTAESLYDGVGYKHYYAEGNYPTLPAAWDANQADAWQHQLNGYTPNRYK